MIVSCGEDCGVLQACALLPIRPNLYLAIQRKVVVVLPRTFLSIVSLHPAIGMVVLTFVFFLYIRYDHDSIEGGQQHM